MVNVAIAGGTSPTLGKSLVEAILAMKKHNVIILSRKPTSSSTSSSNASSSKYGAPIIPVDYDSVTELANTLHSHAIHTLISVLKINSGAAMITYHTRLLHAAQTAKISRFILSDWSLAPASHSRVDLLAHKTALHELSQSHMSQPSSTAVAGEEHIVECCTIQTGGFLEYFAQGCGKLGVQAGLNDDLMREYIDVQGGRVVVPVAAGKESKVEEKGEMPAAVAAVVTMTSIVDIGRYVAAALDLPIGQLTGQIGIAGCNVRYTEVVERLKALRPAVNITPTFITREQCDTIAKEKGKVFDAKMKNGELDIDALKGRMVAQIVSSQCDGAEGGGVVTGRMLNDLCPQVRPVALVDFLTRAWSSD